MAQTNQSAVDLYVTTEVNAEERSSDEKVEFWELRAADYAYAITLLVIVVGTVGNVLSFLVFSRKNMRQSITSYYFRVLAISDTSLLYLGIPVRWVLGVFHYSSYNSSPAACKFLNTSVLCSCYFSCWVLVLIAIDRFIGVFMPHKYKQLCTKRRATVSMVLLLIAILGTVGTFNMLVLGLDSNNQCGVMQKYKWFFHNVYQWTDLFVLNLIPTVVLIGINGSIISVLVKAAWNRQHQTGTTSALSGTTLILLSVSLAYFLCTIPSSTYFIIANLVPKTPKVKAQMLLYKRCGQFLFTTNHAINFFLYCLHGTTFRKELRAMFCGAGKGVYSSTADSSYSMSTTKVVTLAKSESQAID